MTHHRTLYVKTETGGRSEWHTIFWGCTECRSLNHVILPRHRLESALSECPSALVVSVAECLKAGPLYASQLLAVLRRRKNQEVRHVFSSDVAMAVQYLKLHNAVTEEMIDRTEQTIMALKARPWKSKHLDPCPDELKQGTVTKGLVSLYSQRLVPGNRETERRHMQLAPIGILCLHCGYRRVDL
jgi:hypothetical protein